MIRNFQYKTLGIIFCLFILLFTFGCTKEETEKSIDFRSDQIRKDKGEDATGWEEGKPQNVILITVDSLRHDYIGCYGNQEIKTPAMDSLASDGILFERCITTNPQDLPAHCSIMTGIYPEKLGVFDNAVFKLPERFETLAEVLKENNFQTAAFIGSSVLDRRFGLSQGFDDYFDHFDSLLTNTPSIFSERKAEEVISKVLDYLKQRDDDKKLFLWIHLNDPNYDYIPPEPFEKSYKGEVEYVDSQLSRLFDALKANGDYQKSMIVLTSDHGQGLGDHGELRHGVLLFDSTIRVPLIAYASTHESLKKVKNMVGIIDLLPTIARIYDLDYPEVDGREIMELLIKGDDITAPIASIDEGKAQKDKIRPYYFSSYHQSYAFGWKPLRGVYLNYWKYIDADQDYLFDTSSDEGETVDLTHSNKEELEKLRKSLNQFHFKLKDIEFSGENRSFIDYQNNCILTDLGYIWMPFHSLEKANNPPVKELRKLEEILMEAEQAIIFKRVKRAFNMMRKISIMDEKNFQALHYIASKRLSGKRLENAIQSVQILESLYPDRMETLHLKGHIEIFKKDFPKALRIFQEALEIDPLSAELFYDVCCMYSLLDEKEKALTYFEKALEQGFNEFNHIEIDPDLDPIRTEEKFIRVLEKWQNMY